MKTIDYDCQLSYGLLRLDKNDRILPSWARPGREQLSKYLSTRRILKWFINYNLRYFNLKCSTNICTQKRVVQLNSYLKKIFLRSFPSVSTFSFFFVIRFFTQKSISSSKNLYLIIHTFLLFNYLNAKSANKCSSYFSPRFAW